MNRRDIHSGMLEHQVSLQRLTLVPDGVGGGTEHWTQIGTPWCCILPAGGWERLTSMKLEAEITHSIYMRYRADIHPRDRIVFRTRTFDILSIIDLEEAKEFLELKCEEDLD